jgi:Spy/CpxP family protein refolding chaperone
MKKFSMVMAASVLAGLLAVSASGMAQRGPGGGGQRRDPVELLNSELSLSQAQQTKIHSILDGFRSKMQGLRGDPNARDKYESIMKQEQSEIVGVLSSQQRSKLASMGGLRGLMGPSGRMRHELEQLGLNGQQKHKTNVILNDLSAKMEAFRGASRPDFQKLRGVMEDHRNQILAVLTPAQKSKFEADMPMRGPGGPGGARGGR